MPQTKSDKPKREVRGQQSAWIVLNGLGTSKCEMVDLSNRGAKLVPDGSFVVPARFELAFVHKGEQKRQSCEVLWRRGRMLGVRLLKHPT